MTILVYNNNKKQANSQKILHLKAVLNKIMFKRFMLLDLN